MKTSFKQQEIVDHSNIALIFLLNLSLNDEMSRVEGKNYRPIKKICNRGFDKFIGTMQVLPNGDNGTIFKWSVVASPVAGITYEGFVDSLNVNLAGIVALIENLF
ncbi:hypothetical protein LIER_26513 [Lithospermum erythrorhizon]|uniref:Uncharacterized protein n=1 Tax=Lithospermum erythrorhizon TaxID=34254 RepID=A0AAV3R8V4_LITER